MDHLKAKKWTEYVLLIGGLFISGLGVAITKKGELGVSPISSVANVLTPAFPHLTLGNWLIVWNCVLILGQIVLLRKEFKLYQFLQIPLSFLFGYFTDAGAWLIAGIPAESYAMRLLCVVIGTAVVGLGVVLTVHADIIMNSGEAFVSALARKTGKEFGNLKIAFDLSCVVISLLLSLLLFGGEIRGTREGTVISAIFTGICIKFFTRLIYGREKRAK